MAAILSLVGHAAESAGGLLLDFPQLSLNQVYQNVKEHNVHVKECKTISKGQWKTIFKLV